MAQEILNLGAAPNDKTGEGLRDGGVKINNNFTELYNGDNTEYAEYHLTTTPEVVSLNNDGVTYTKIPNMVLNTGSGFSITSGTLTKDVTSGLFLINGVSDLESNLAAEICYALVVNGTVVPSEITCHTFANQAKIENISITAIAQINTGDTIEIHAKGDGTNNIDLTVKKLDVTFLMIKKL